jgi:hypothetical protein
LPWRDRHCAASVVGKGRFSNAKEDRGLTQPGKSRWNFLGKPESLAGIIEELNKEGIMTDEFKVGDKVQWQSPQGAVHGTIKKKLTSHTTIKGHEVAASPENPEYLVVSDKTGAEAAHKATALKKA